MKEPFGKVGCFIGLNIRDGANMKCLLVKNPIGDLIFLSF